MQISTFIQGGMLAGYRTYIVSGIGILTAVGAYLTGDADLFATLQAVFTMGGIYFLRKSNEQKGKTHGKNSRKIS